MMLMQKEVEKAVDKALEKPPTYLNLQCKSVNKYKIYLELHKVISNSESFSYTCDQLILKFGIKILLETLEKFEISSRASGNHMNSIVVMKIFDCLTQHKEGRFNTRLVNLLAMEVMSV
jgi:hypothetical protein